MGDALRRPAFQGDDKCILQSIFSQLKILDHANQAGQDSSVLFRKTFSTVWLMTALRIAEI